MIMCVEIWLIDRRQRVVVNGRYQIGNQLYIGCYCTKCNRKGKGLTLTISADMKVSEQGEIAAAMRNQIIGFTRRNIVYKEKELILALYKTIVRPHLEYCIQAWRHYRKKDID